MTKKRVQTLLVTIILLVGSFITNQVTHKGGESNPINQVVNNITAPKNNTDDKNLTNLEYKSGQDATVTINNNKSTLNPSNWKSNQVDYQNLDRLNRTSSSNVAYLENRNLASGDLRVRQYVNPTGWHQKFVNGQPIINRGHLIAYSISKGISSSGRYSSSDMSGDQNNPRNLFTQTAFANQKVQTIYESKIRNALYHHKRVIFYAKPFFKGNELMARGVQLQAISTDKTLNFNVYIFNVEPGVKFDYLTGRSTIDRNMNVPDPT